MVRIPVAAVGTVRDALLSVRAVLRPRIAGRLIIEDIQRYEHRGGLRLWIAIAVTGLAIAITIALGFGIGHRLRRNLVDAASRQQKEGRDHIGTEHADGFHGEILSIWLTRSSIGEVWFNIY